MKLRNAAIILLLTAAPAMAQIARTPDGKPNLNGMWQAMSDANWDIEAHAAAPGALVQTGAIGATPPGMGIVEGGAIPYQAAALAKKRDNYKNRMSLDPEVKCYLPGVPR